MIFTNNIFFPIVVSLLFLSNQISSLPASVFDRARTRSRKSSRCRNHKRGVHANTRARRRLAARTCRGARGTRLHDALLGPVSPPRFVQSGVEWSSNRYIFLVIPQNLASPRLYQTFGNATLILGTANPHLILIFVFYHRSVTLGRCTTMSIPHRNSDSVELWINLAFISLDN
jgi:hypothetical protein